MSVREHEFEKAACGHCGHATAHVWFAGSNPFFGGVVLRCTKCDSATHIVVEQPRMQVSIAPGSEGCFYVSGQKAADSPVREPLASSAPAVPDRVNHPPHYGGKDDPYEAIKLVEGWGLGFSAGNALKYLCRAGRKDGSLLVEDLEKCLWYLQRAYAAHEKRLPVGGPLRPAPDAAVWRWFPNDPNGRQALSEISINALWHAAVVVERMLAIEHEQDRADPR